MTARRLLGALGAVPGCRTGAAVVSAAVLVALVPVAPSARASVERPPSGRAAAQAEREALSLLHVATAALDPRRLGLLAENYALSVAGSCSRCPAHVVQARRPDGTVAGRFWLDRETGLLRRQQVFSPAGDRVRTSAFVDVSVTQTAVAPSEVRPQRLPDRRSVAALRAGGWPVLDTLPGGFRLLETSLSTHGRGQEVLHLSYSDGLSSLSLFGQHGRLGTAGMSGFEAETVASRPVWVQHAAPERVVWSGAGRVWTLVSDASPTSVREAVATLPRDEPPRTGLLSRLSRGTARLAGLLNPFD